MEDFETVKKKFDGLDPMRTFRVRLPAIARSLMGSNPHDPKYDFEEGDVLLSHTDMEGMFAPVIKKSLELVKQQ